MSTRNLEQILAGLPVSAIAGPEGVEISGIAYDSRQVKPGFLFLCLEGEKFDGHSFIPQAIANGAVAIAGQKEIEVPPGITYVRLPDTRSAAGRLASAFYGEPAQQLRAVGVTGTNGKTTTTFLTDAILTAAGHKVGLMGTIKTKIGDREQEAERTTPEGVDLQAFCREILDAGGDYLVMEVSSHALDRQRVAGCEYDVAVFTNLTRDHLDYHKTMENYLQAKTKLFTGLADTAGAALKARKGAVLNADDPASEAIRAQTTVPVLTYGVKKAADIRAEGARFGASGMSVHVRTPLGEADLNLKLSGLFNVYNTLAAIGVGLTEGISLLTMKKALEAFPGVPGRFELVNGGQDFTVIVDYAHTPDGLENILNAAREFATQRIIVVFGCGGDRDRTKRPMMGEIAAKLSDYCIVTSDNPRSEDPAAIIREVEVGVKRVTSDYEAFVDRRAAIEKALSLAQKDDVVLLAGKGHETYQVLKDQTIHFDDREIAREYLGGR